MVTTIKIHKETKLKLDSLRKNSQTYEDIIKDLIKTRSERMILNEMKKGYEQSEVDEEWLNFE